MSDPHATLVRHMILVHHALTRAFERLQEHARRCDLPTAQLRLGVRQCVVFLRGHHLQEDEVFLPLLRQKGRHDVDWGEVGHQHERLASLLARLEHAPDAEVAELLAALLPLLASHVAHEERVLHEVPWRQLLTVDEVRALGRALSAHARRHLKPASLQLPLLLYNLDPEERREFTAPMPAVLVRGVVPWAFRPAWRKLRPFLTWAPAPVLSRA